MRKIDPDGPELDQPTVSAIFMGAIALRNANSPPKIHSDEEACEVAVTMYMEIAGRLQDIAKEYDERL